MKYFLSKGKKGMVLIIVIIAIMLMSIVTVGILSRNVSSSFVDERGRQRFQAELLAKGCFWRLYQLNGTAPAFGSCDETIDNTPYTVTYTVVPGAGPLGTAQILTQVTY
jgi:hypothetical protein